MKRAEATARSNYSRIFAGTGFVLVTLFIGRMAIDMEHSMIYIFFPTFARDFQVQVWQTGLLVTVYSGMNLASPIFGRLSDRIGRKIMMIIGLGVFCVAETLFILANDWIMVLAGRTITGLSASIFNPSQFAYLGDEFEYSRRARIMGLVRLAFPVSGVLAPIYAGYSIQNFSWRTPFLTMDILALFAIPLLVVKLPKGVPSSPRPHQDKAVPSFKNVLTDRTVLPCLVSSFLAIWSIEGFWAFMALWFKEAFSVGEIVIGAIFSLSSIASVIGTMVATWRADRIGKKRCTWMGLLPSALLMLVVPNLRLGLPIAVLAVFLLGATFDFAMTAWLPLLTELQPKARGTMMSLNSAATSLGAATGALMNGFIWTVLGYAYVGLACFTITLISAAIVRYEVSERQQPFPRTDAQTLSV